LYDISSAYPLKMSVVGVLAESETADDYVVFVDVKTAWVIEGLGHGHTDLSKTDDKNLILKRDKKTVVGTAAVGEYREITKDNIDSFHFHGGRKDFLLTSVIVLPYSPKAATILKSRYNVSETRQMLAPLAVVDELMEIVFKVKRFFDANFAMITLVTILFVLLVVLLSMRIRKREMETMFKIGCSRMTLFLLQLAELSIIVAVSLTLAAVFVSVLLLCAPEVIRIV
jgi:putative ABC transport system permease protein